MDLETYKRLSNEITSSPFGIGIAQTWTQLGMVFLDIGKYGITLFIELGTYLGGMSEMLIMRQSVLPECRYWGFDYDASVLHPRMKGNSQITIGNVFDAPIIAQISSMINESPGAVMIYCDNGDKPREMRTYAPLMRVGDYLRAHDYPGETTPESLDKFKNDFPYMEEIDQERCREFGFSLWKRTR